MVNCVHRGKPPGHAKCLPIPTDAKKTLRHFAYNERGEVGSILETRTKRRFGPLADLDIISIVCIFL